VSDSDAYDYLPPTLAKMAELAGLPAALAVAEAKGGREVYIPRRAPDSHWLVEAVGREAADKIGSHFGDQRLQLPLGPRKFYARARRRAAELLKGGASLNTVVDQTGVCVRSAKRYKKRLGNDSQGGLF
jgi:hypothetical protein